MQKTLFNETATRKESTFQQAARQVPALWELRRKVAVGMLISEATAELGELVGIWRMPWDQFLSSNAVWQSSRAELVACACTGVRVASDWWSDDANTSESIFGTDRGAA